jgi:uncharacterized membrane protein (UPF0127 family)
MFFVFYPIAAIWINQKGKVTSAQMAKPWRPYYAAPEFLEKISVGDFIDFEDPN